MAATRSSPRHVAPVMLCGGSWRITRGAGNASCIWFRPGPPTNCTPRHASSIRPVQQQTLDSQLSRTELMELRVKHKSDRHAS